MSEKTFAGETRAPVVLCILDGWGNRADRTANAIALADTPTWDRLVADCPTAELVCHGPDVGLPAGQMGNSEVGHLNIGAGRIVWQDLPRINNAIAEGSLADHPLLVDLTERLRESGGVCHLAGIASPGGVHGHENHLLTLAKIVASRDVPVHLHIFLDGRDTPPTSAADDVSRLETAIADIPGVRIATLIGRYFAMDRDHRWERVRAAHNLLVEGTGASAETASQAVADAYAADTTDEFIPATVITGVGDRGMRDGDGFLFANFRADRARQLLDALLAQTFDGFERTRTVAYAAQVGMVSYSDNLDAALPALFPPDRITATLGETLAAAGVKQLRLAETEKYPHVTFFLNGGREQPFTDEARHLCPSPKVATYDLAPEMAAHEITDHLVTAITERSHAAIIVNFANGDMVGHTGDLKAATAACAAVDRCLARIIAAIDDTGGAMLLTADHGNCEMMVDPKTGGPHTAHTVNPVPIVLVGATANQRLIDGRLADIAPTMLALLELEKPEEMTGRSLLV